MYIDTIKIPIKKPIPRDQNILDCWRVIPGWNFFVSSQSDLNIFSNIKNWRVIYYSLTKTLIKKVILFWYRGCWFEKLRSDFLAFSVNSLPISVNNYYFRNVICCKVYFLLCGFKWIEYVCEALAELTKQLLDSTLLKLVCNTSALEVWIQKKMPDT